LSRLSSHGTTAGLGIGGSYQSGRRLAGHGVSGGRLAISLNTVGPFSLEHARVGNRRVLH
jgi:hypothetical protein